MGCPVCLHFCLAGYRFSCPHPNVWLLLNTDPKICISVQTDNQRANALLTGSKPGSQDTKSNEQIGQEALPGRERIYHKRTQTMSHNIQTTSSCKCFFFLLISTLERKQNEKLLLPFLTQTQRDVGVWLVKKFNCQLDQRSQDLATGSRVSRVPPSSCPYHWSCWTIEEGKLLFFQLAYV